MHWQSTDVSMLRSATPSPGAVPSPCPLPQAPVNNSASAPCTISPPQVNVGQMQSFLWLWCAAREALCRIVISLLVQRGTHQLLGTQGALGKGCDGAVGKAPEWSLLLSLLFSSGPACFKKHLQISPLSCFCSAQLPAAFSSGWVPVPAAAPSQCQQPVRTETGS